jgi:GNAT superfamily N-acetyltransferase
MNGHNASTRHRDIPPIRTPQPAGELPAIIRADASQAHHLAGLIADSFRHLPPSQWLVPDAVDRPEVLRDFFTIAVEHAAHHGIVDTLADGSAVAVWFDHTRPDGVPEPFDYDNRRRQACGRYTEQFMYLDELLARNYPPEPHFHLAFIAVAEAVQGTGRGTALLRHRHNSLDGGCWSAYLEAASERLVTVYEKFGYLASEPMRLGSDGPLFYPMLRLPYADFTR